MQQTAIVKACRMKEQTELLKPYVFSSWNWWGSWILNFRRRREDSGCSFAGEWWGHPQFLRSFSRWQFPPVGLYRDWLQSSPPPAFPRTCILIIRLGTCSYYLLAITKNHCLNYSWNVESSYWMIILDNHIGESYWIIIHISITLHYITLH